MKKNNKKNKKTVVIALYGLAIVFAIYTIFTMYNSYTYISSLVTQGLVIKDELSSVITYFASASIPYLFYSIATWVMGYIISKLGVILNEVKTPENFEILDSETSDLQVSEDE